VEASDPPDPPRWAKLVKTVIGAGQTLFGFLVMGLIAYLVIAVAIDLISGSDSHSTPPTLSRTDAEAAVKRYYGALDHFQYGRAWSFLGQPQQTADVGFGIWSRSLKRNYEMNLTSLTISPRSRTTATAVVSYKRLDYDACNNKVWQTYTGTWTVSLAQGQPVLQGEDVRKVAGPDPVTVYADCQTHLPPPPTQPVAAASSDSGFCSTHSCIPSFDEGNGYIVQCADGEWSHSGGLSGACSYHGGER
jgi:hypothetical protein